MRFTANADTVPDPNQVDFRNPASFHHDIASVATLLKHFLRDLPDPLLTSSFYEDFIAAVKINDDIIRRDSLHALINNLPDPNYATLRVLILHLDRVAMRSGRNRMVPSNLAICFGPTFLGSPAGAGDNRDAGWQARVVETILNNTFQIFDDDDDDVAVAVAAASAERASQLAKSNSSQVSEDNDVRHDDDNVISNTASAERRTRLAKWTSSKVSEAKNARPLPGIPSTAGKAFPLVSPMLEEMTSTSLAWPEQPSTQKSSSRLRSLFSRGKKKVGIDRRSVD